MAGNVPKEIPRHEITDASPFALNELYEARFASEQEAARRAARLASSREALTSAKEKLDTAERKRRKARSDFDQVKTGVKEELRRALQLRQLDSRLAQEEVHLRTLETRAAQSERDAGQSGADFDEQIRTMREKLAKGIGESTAGFAALAQREGEARRSRDAAVRRLATCELRLETAATRLANQTEPSADQFEEVEAITARRDALREQIALADAQLERLIEAMLPLADAPPPASTNEIETTSPEEDAEA